MAERKQTAGTRHKARQRGAKSAPETERGVRVVTLDKGESRHVEAPSPQQRVDQPVPAHSVGDLTRLLLLLDEVQRVRKLTSSELEALSYLAGTERDVDGSPKWPALRFAYRYRFSPTPGSDELYDDLLRLENADLVRRKSPVEVTPRGEQWLKDPRYGDALGEIRDQARAAAQAYAGRTNLVELSIQRGGDELEAEVKAAEAEAKAR